MLAPLIAAAAYRLDLDGSGQTFTNLRTGAVEIAKAPLFVVTFRDGRRWAANDAAKLTDDATGLRVTVAREPRATYLRETFTLSALRGDVDVARFDAVDADVPGARVSGTVQGSPVLTEDAFFGLEEPMSSSTVESGHVRCGMVRKLPIHPGSPVTYSAVMGTARKGGMRRDFLAYLEAERPRRYQPFLHYNSWYDIGYFNRYTQTEALDRIRAVGEALSVRRGVKLASFLFDDGWDDTATAWEFNRDFPQGFAPLRDAAGRYGAGPGMWLSPWGGYGTPHTERVATARRLGYETGDEGYSLSGPKYYARFHDQTLKFVREYNVDHFKLDGTGSPDRQYAGSTFSSDFDAAISLIKDLRAAKPGLFVNLTTGTWPSPFWTRYADSIWRGGQDHAFAGVGPDRERWITYRDGDTYHGIVQQGPLYPLNSLMLHGLIYAQHANHLTSDAAGAFRHEVRDYFGTGTQLQEMYITPALLSSDDWDTIAEAAKWSAANAQTLVDVHWTGGDPLRGEVYGYAAWSPTSAILTLRNPSDKPQTYALDLAKALEVPGRAGTAAMRSPWKGETRTVACPLNGTVSVTLAPFEVLTLQGKA